MDEEPIRIPREREFAPRALDDLSVDALEAYAAQLEGELARVRGEIGAKQAHLSRADSLFKR